MNRKAILSISIVILFSLLLTAILITTMPIWLTVLMINPRAIDPIREKVMAKFMLETSRMMVRSMRGKKMEMM